MFNILILLLLGIASGYVFRNGGFLKNIDKSVSATVLFMLFVFGISIGNNSELMNNLGRYGIHAAILASFGTAGSLLASYFAYKLLFGKKRKGGEK